MKETLGSSMKIVFELNILLRAISAHWILFSSINSTSDILKSKSQCLFFNTGSILPLSLKKDCTLSLPWSNSILKSTLLLLLLLLLFKILVLLVSCLLEIWTLKICCSQNLLLSKSVALFVLKVCWVVSLEEWQLKFLTTLSFDTNILFGIKTNSSACITNSSRRVNRRDLSFGVAVNLLPIADVFSSKLSLLKTNVGLMIRSFQVNFYLWARFHL